MCSQSRVLFGSSVEDESSAIILLPCRLSPVHLFPSRLLPALLPSPSRSRAVSSHSCVVSVPLPFPCISFGTVRPLVDLRDRSATWKSFAGTFGARLYMCSPPLANRQTIYLVSNKFHKMHKQTCFLWKMQLLQARDCPQGVAFVYSCEFDFRRLYMYSCPPG